MDPFSQLFYRAALWFSPIASWGIIGLVAGRYYAWFGDY